MLNSTVAIGDDVDNTIGALTVAASDSADIDATITANSFNFSGSTAGNATGVAIGVSIARNFIGFQEYNFGGTPTNKTVPASTVGAYVVNSSVTADEGISVTADTTSSIDAVLSAISIAVAASASGNATGVAVGGLGAENSIGRDTLAYVSGGALLRSDYEGITVTASDTATINASAVSVGGTAAIGSSNATTVSVALVLVFNNIENDVQAYIENVTDVQADGAITVSATNNATIDAIGAAVSISASAGLGGNAVAVSAGGALITNSINNDTIAYIDNADIDADIQADGGAGNISVTALFDGTINATVLAVQAAVAAGTNNSVAVSVGAGVALNSIEDNLGKNKIHAYIKDSEIDAGDITVSATSDADIDAIVIAASVAIGIGQNGVAVSAVGSAATNRIRNDVQAYIDGDGTGGTAGIRAGNVDVSVSDSGSIDSNAFGAAVAAAFGSGTSVAVPIGVSIAINDIDTSAYAGILNVDDELEATGSVSVTGTQDAAIDAVTAAAAFAVAAGSTGVGVAGGGAVAINTILSDLTATIENSHIDAAGDISVTATASGDIDARTVAIALGVAGGSTGVGVALGASVVINDIGFLSSRNDADSDNWTLTRDGAGVKALVTDSIIETDGVFTVTADSDQSIDATTVAASVAAAFGSTGVGAAGSGVWSQNNIAVDVSAVVSGTTALGSSDATVTADRIVVSAEDDSTIDAFAGSAALSLALGSTAVAVSVGLAFANNRIESAIAAGFEDIDSITTTDVDAEPDIDISATDSSAITAQSAAAALAVAGGSTGVAVSGGGAFAFNSIQTDVEAFIDRSDVDASGDISITADATGSIDATVLAVAASAAFGQTGIGVALGAAVAINDIGYLGVRTDEDPTTWITNRQSALVEARIADSTVDTDNDLSVVATANQTIDAVVQAGAVAIAGGQTGVAVGGSGVFTQNNIGTDVAAIISGHNANATVDADTLTLTATNSSSIDALAGAVAVSAAVGQVGVAVSIGVAISNNLISSTTRAGIDHLDAVNTDGGDDNPDIAITATDSAIIRSIGAAAALAAGFGQVGVAVSGAGAVTGNDILTETEAFIRQTATGNIAGDVTITASSSATIEAITGAASAAIAGGFVGVGVSIGAAFAHNNIGFSLGIDPDGTLVAGTALVHAYIEDSNLSIAGDLTLDADSDQTINAAVDAVSIGVAAGAVGVAAAGSGVSVVNNIAVDAAAYIDGSANGGRVDTVANDAVSASSITILADDTSNIDAQAGAVAVTLAVGFYAGVSVSLAGTIAVNTISSTTRAYITDMDSASATAGSITVDATANASIDTLALAVSFAAGFAAFGGVGRRGRGRGRLQPRQRGCLGLRGLVRSDRHRRRRDRQGG